MKTILPGYCSKRLIKLEDTIMDANEDLVDDVKANSLQKDPINDSIEEENDDFHLVNQISSSNLNLKFIDDNDTDSLNSILNLNKHNVDETKPEIKSQTTQTAQEQITKTLTTNNTKKAVLFKFNYQVDQVGTYENLIKKIENLNTDIQDYFNQTSITTFNTNKCLLRSSSFGKSDYHSYNNNNNKPVNDLLRDIKSCLNLIKNIFYDSKEKLKSSKKMNSNDRFSMYESKISEIEDLDKVVNETKILDNSLSAPIKDLTEGSASQSLNRNEELVSQNKELRDKIASLEEQLKKKEDECNQLKEAFEVMKLDRKRLKCERLELLSQTKELYKTIQSKELEIGDFLKTFEKKNKETALTVKKLMDSKTEIEKEKHDLNLQLNELVEEKSELKLVIESKCAAINKLQKQIFELKTKSPRYSLGKESDYGYASSKSRDTLSSSMIETTPLNTTISNSNENNTPTSNNTYELKSKLIKLKTKKEERNLKCKSNDSFIYVKNQQLNESIRKSNQKLKNKFKSSSAQPQQPLEPTQLADIENKQIKKSNLSINLNDYDADLNKVLDSDGFIDLDDVVDTPQVITKNKTNLDVQKSSCSSSSTSFSTANEINTNLLQASTLSSSSSSKCTIPLITTTANTTTTNSISPSVSLSSSSSYKHETANIVANNEPANEKKFVLNTSSSSSSTNSSPMIMCQSLTICEDENVLNKTSNDFSNTSHYSVKQPLSVSMSVNAHNSNILARSSKLFHSIIKMSSSSPAKTNKLNAEPKTVVKSKTAILNQENVHDENRQRDPNSVSCLASKSSCSVNEVSTAGGSSLLSSSSSIRYSLCTNKFATLNHSMFNKSCKIAEQNSASMTLKRNSYKEPDQLNRRMHEFSYDDLEELNELSELNLNESNIYKWTPNMIKLWLENIGMMPLHIKSALKHIKNGKQLFMSMSDSELEKAFAITNQMHKRKLKLAIDDLKSPEKCKYTKINEITTEWLCNTWLKDIGLIQLQGIFKLNLIDGRVLASLQRKDLEKYLGISKRSLQTSLLLAIEFLKKHEFDIQKIDSLRSNYKTECTQVDLSLWKNDYFVNWLKLVNLQSFVNKLDESGIHGALVADSLFNVEFLYACLSVPEEARYLNMKKIIEDEIKLLRKPKSKNETTFTRSFKNDKKFTFRGSLGRALGKKIRRDISSPLIDDDTYKRIEYNHKIVDMKQFSAV